MTRTRLIIKIESSAKFKRKPKDVTHFVRACATKPILDHCYNIPDVSAGQDLGTKGTQHNLWNMRRNGDALETVVASRLQRLATAGAVFGFQ